MKAKIPITKLTLPHGEYVKQATKKSQLYLHHSAGRDNVRGMFKYWENQPGRIATAYAIDDPGQIFQGFSHAYWAYHLYIRSAGNQLSPRLLKYKRHIETAIHLEKISIGVEIANFGPLVYREGKYYTWVHNFGCDGPGVTLSENKVYDFGANYNFRGFRFYERYTDNEVQALKLLIEHITDDPSNDIVKDVRGNIFDINDDAFRGKPGIYTHCSVRTDKTDVVPQAHLVDMLYSICK